eukprot:gnl/MRDRNA2_/MRDRNA2_115352_c0_seq1.p1 gnl/MRDRNA2_/MRDRNA2_115352_c0~~gnl/MRDRNA2_/MRDRNA2_115352_c0_seq1.p1  ORF type:complete len:291 (+),score=67.97 gnl/MRDRNA2_/MRDRNA2_115352_c0_seq1:61-933(+)
MMILTKVLVALVAMLCTTPVTSFPVTSLSVPQSTFAKLNSTSTGNDGLATQVLLPALQGVFKDVKYQIEVESGDVVISAQFPDTQVDGDCHHKIEAEHPKAVGTIEKSSFLRFGVSNVSWHGATVFADAELDSKLDINTDVCVRVGEEIFGHHCSQIARKTVGIDVLSDGQTGIGLNLTAYNAHIAKVNGTWSLVFNFHATVVGTVLHWNVEKVTADNCKIKIIGIEIASVCGTIERHVKDKVQTLTDQVMTVTAPNLLKKLQDKINTKIGDVVVIPLKIGDEEMDTIII